MRPRLAWRSQPFFMLASAYFVCGFTVHLLSTHLVPYARDKEISPLAAGTALGIMGAMNVVGMLVMGALADKIGRKNALAATYLIRVVGVLGLLFVADATSLNIVAAVTGFTLLVTSPLTAALVADTFDPRTMGSIMGLISATHQLGGAAGAYFGGLSHDFLGGYQPAFWLATLLLIGAGIASYKFPTVKAAVAARS